MIIFMLCHCEVEYNEFEGKPLGWDGTSIHCIQGPNIRSPMRSLFGGFTVVTSYQRNMNLEGGGRGV